MKFYVIRPTYIFYGTDVYSKSSEIKEKEALYKVRTYPKEYVLFYVNYNGKYITFSTEYLVIKAYKKRVKKRFLIKPT